MPEIEVGGYGDLKPEQKRNVTVGRQGVQETLDHSSRAAGEL